MAFDNIEIPSPRRLLIREIEERIISGKLAIGEKLPTERELHAQTGINKSEVHAAIKDLEHMGFIKIVPRQGTYVADYIRTGSFETLNEILRYNGGKISFKMSVDLVEMRNAIEGAALIRLAANHTCEDIELLRSKVDELRAVVDKNLGVSELAKMSYRFHCLICELSGNNMFLLMMNSFTPLGMVLWENCAAFWGAEGFLEQDEKIVDMIEHGEGPEAKKYIEDIFAQFIEAFKSYKQRLNKQE